MDRLAQLLALLEESPSDPFLHFALAKEWETRGELTRALEAWAWFAEHAPQYTGYYYHHVQLLRKAGQAETALEVLARGLEVTRQQGDHHAHGELRSLAPDPYDSED